jgi:hypothetical protein
VPEEASLSDASVVFMQDVFVGVAKIRLVLAQAHSLKEKRMVLRRMRDRVREQVGVAISEVGDQDVWQRAELGVSVASGDRAKALEVLDHVVRVVAAAGGGDVVAIARDVLRFESEPEPVALTIGLDRTGSGDKAVAGDDWIPDAWKQDDA